MNDPTPTQWAAAAKVLQTDPRINHDVPWITPLDPPAVVELLEASTPSPVQPCPAIHQDGARCERSGGHPAEHVADGGTGRGQVTW